MHTCVRPIGRHHASRELEARRQAKPQAERYGMASALESSGDDRGQRPHVDRGGAAGAPSGYSFNDASSDDDCIGGASLVVIMHQCFLVGPQRRSQNEGAARS